MPLKRDVIDQFKREELQDFADQYALEVADRRVRDDLVAALSRSRRASLSEMLATLSRDRLKEICVGLDLDDSGREKSAIIERICGEPDDDDEGHDPSALLNHFLGDAFRLTSHDGSWPMRATYALGGQELDLQIYARVIGGSSRSNPLERRFQNPSKRSPILVDAGARALLLGIWLEQGDARMVIVAMDAYRRVERETRFSLFMPLSLLEKAADTGFATHENTKGEVLYAFRPENFASRYLPIFLDEAPRPDAHAPDTKGRVERVAEPHVQTSELYIRPRVGMYAAFARLNYKPWFALAEFLDNSIQSFLHHRGALAKAGLAGPLVIDVTLDDHEISVTDRAGGIAWKDFPRAFSPAAPPDDASGLSEFGLGMKAAACWFARKWTVTTSALGEEVQRTVTFDVPRISREGVENLPIESRPARASDHFTTITLRDLRVRPRGRTLKKIKEHLAGIYRVLTAEDIVRIRFTASGQAEELKYEPPALLSAPYYRTPSAEPVLWRKEFSYDLQDRRVTGWAGVMAVGSYSRAGFSVFRRRRLIEGSVDETYKPHAIFGSPNSFRSQRVVGEIYVDGFDVTHTKDGIQWDGYEDEVLQAILGQLDSAKLALLDQAEGYRARKTGASLPADFGEEAMTSVAAALSAPEAVSTVHAESAPERAEEPPPAPPVVGGTSQTRTISMQVMRDAKPLQIELELIRDPAHPFYSTAVELIGGHEVIKVRVNLEHELSVLHINENEQALQPVLRLVAALSLGEKTARDSGVRSAGAVRRNANEILGVIARHTAE